MSFFSKLPRFCAALAVTTSGVSCVNNLTSDNRCNMTPEAVLSNSKLQLCAVHVYFRHGARTPFTDLPGKAGQVAFWSSKEHCRSPQLAVDVRIVDGKGVLRESPPYAPEKDKSARLNGGGDCWVGALTVDGQNACLALGRRLRRRYGQLLSVGYNANDLQLRSTNFNRTIHSMRCLLYGLFEAEHMKLTIDPPLVEVLHDQDTLVPKYSTKSKVADLLTADLISVRRNVISALKSEDPGIDEDFNDPLSKNFLLLHNFYDTIISFLYHGFPVSNALLEHKSKLEWASCMEIMRHMLGHPRDWADYLPHIVGGECEKLQHQLLVNDTAAVCRPSLHLNATHDTFIMCLLEAFELFDYTWPNYASDLVVELWKEPVTAGIPKFWVRVVYCGKVQQLPDSDNGWCSLEEFSRRLSVYVVASKNATATTF